MIHKGYKLEFTRRRYGKTTFTWIYVKIGDKPFPTGDPVQKIMPSRKDLDEAIKSAFYRSPEEFFSKRVAERQSEIQNFIEAQLSEFENDCDFWAALDDTIDIHFFENDDDQSENFGKMECFAYPIGEDRNGHTTTNTSICVQVK